MNTKNGNTSLHFLLLVNDMISMSVSQLYSETLQKTLEHSSTAVSTV